MTKVNFGQTNPYVSIGISARTCTVVGQFVVLAPLASPYAVRWSAIGDPQDWPTPNTDDARSKQSGLQEFPNVFGVVTGIAGNDFFGYVFQEKAVTKMTYIGGDVVFSFDTFEEGRGCHTYNRYVSVDDSVFFESQYGYHKLTDGVIQDIGYGRVDDTYTPVTS